MLSLCEQAVENIVVKSLRCFDARGSVFKMDVNLTADIVTMGLGSKKQEADRKEKWFTVHLKAVIRDNLQVLKDDVVTEEFNPVEFDKKFSLDEFLVPYIYGDDLEDIADDFTLLYCEDAVYSDYRLPIQHILYKMGIQAYIADLPETTMGRMYFKEDRATIYVKIPYLGETKEENSIIKSGTILISKKNFFIGKTGSVVLTGAHEIIHWYLHQNFFKILSLLDSNIKMMSCDIDPRRYSEGLPKIQKALWFAEWQANALSIRIAMPRGLFLRAFEEVYESEKNTPRMHSYKAELIEDVVRKLSTLFDVSIFAVKQRAIQLGLDIVAGTNIYIDGKYHFPFTFRRGVLGKNQTFVIDGRSLNALCSKNYKLKELLDSRKFIYLGYVICINDSKFLENIPECQREITGFEYDLNDYAREHVDECCLIFDWRSVYGDKDYGGFYGQCYLDKDVSAEMRIEHYYNPNFENNQSVVSLAEQVAKYKSAFDKEREIMHDTPDNFADALRYHMNRKKITLEDLAYRSGLSTTTVKNYRSGKIVPDVDNIMAIFIGLNLPEKYCDAMLELARLSLPDKTLKQKVYRVLIREHSDGNLDQWNFILHEFGLSSIPNLRNQKTSTR